jgi:starvation-inducible DNA-binding protein
MAKANQLSRIGLETKVSEKLANGLNDLLANYQIFYMNVRGFHWNIKGDKFFELHLKFEELYNDALIKIDEIAERVLTLGFTPTHSYSDYIKKSEIRQQTNITDGYKAVEQVLSSFKTLIVKERVLLNVAAEANDEGTNALMSDYIRAQEKLVWMYASFMDKKK